MKKSVLFLVAILFSFSMMAQTIYEIQGQEDASPFADQEVTTTGVITAVRAYADPYEVRGFFLQDGEGEWNGIYVHADINQDVAVGDEVTVIGTCVEYYDMTEISPTTSVTINSSGNTLPVATTVATSDLGESYEGVLVKVVEAECTAIPDEHEIWTINDGSGDSFVDDWMFHLDPDPVVGTEYTITGCLIYDYSQYKVCPRDADDVGVSASISNLDNSISIYPNPATDYITIKNAKQFNSMTIVNIAGLVVYSSNNTSTVEVANFQNGVYFIVLEGENGTVSRKFVK